MRFICWDDHRFIIHFKRDCPLCWEKTKLGIKRALYAGANGRIERLEAGLLELLDKYEQAQGLPKSKGTIFMRLKTVGIIPRKEKDTGD